MHKIMITEFEAFCQEQRGLGEHSLRAYRQDLKSFSNFLAECGAASVNSDTVLAYQRFLREERGASPATIRRRMVTLRGYYAWRDRQQPSCLTPFSGIQLDLRVPQRLPRPVDRPVLSAVFRNSAHIAVAGLDDEESTEPQNEPTKDQITGLIARLLVVTGLRIGELTNACLRDVMGAGAQIRVMGKGSRERTVYVTNERLLADFGAYLGMRRRVSGADGFVFLNTRGGRLTEAAFRKRLRRLSEELQIEPHITPHRFRHSAATLLIEEGVDIRLVQRLLGHASISTTEIYTKVSDNSLFQAIEHADTLEKVDS